jgi:hypothetical protein
VSPQSSSAPSPRHRVIALALVAIGALVMVGSVFADAIGISGGGDGFGWKQLIAAITGLVLLLAGAAWFLRPVLGELPDELGE